MLIGQLPIGMHGDFYRGRPEHAGHPVPGNLVPALIYRCHDGVRPIRAPDREPEKPLIGEHNASASGPIHMISADIQDGRARLIAAFCEVAEFEAAPKAQLLAARLSLTFLAAGRVAVEEMPVEVSRGLVISATPAPDRMTLFRVKVRTPTLKVDRPLKDAIVCRSAIRSSRRAAPAHAQRKGVPGT